MGVHTSPPLIVKPTPPKRFGICLGSEESSEPDGGGQFLKSHWPNTRQSIVYSASVLSICKQCCNTTKCGRLPRRAEKSLLKPHRKDKKMIFLLWRNPKPKANFLDWIEKVELERWRRKFLPIPIFSFGFQFVFQAWLNWSHLKIFFSCSSKNFPWFDFFLRKNSNYVSQFLLAISYQ